MQRAGCQMPSSSRAPRPVRGRADSLRAGPRGDFRRRRAPWVTPLRPCASAARPGLASRDSAREVVCPPLMTALQPLTARRVRAAPGPRPRAGRQVDLASRHDLRPAGVGRDRASGPARRRGRAAHRPRPAARWARPVERAGRRARGASTASASAACSPPADVLDFGNAGTGSRLTMGLVGGYGITATFDRRRLAAQAADAPRARSAARRWACRCSRRRDRRPLPLTLRGAADPLPIAYRTPVASAQVKSAVLLAGLNAPGLTTVIETGGDARPHREDAAAISAPTSTVDAEGEGGRRISLEGQGELDRAGRRGAGRSRPRPPSRWSRR